MAKTSLNVRILESDKLHLSALNKETYFKVWMSYTDFDGTPLNTRLHWAKEAPRYLEVEGLCYETMDYVHKNYENPMRTFFDDLNELTEGVSIQDLNSLFSNR